MRKTLSLFGTGIYPSVLSDGLSDNNSIIDTSGVCPACNEQIYDICSLGRDYLSILYMPIFPLGLCLINEHCSKIRLPLDIVSKGVVLDYLNTFATNHYSGRSRNIGLRGTYFAAFLFTILGALLGWFFLSKIFGLGSGIKTAVLLILSIAYAFWDIGMNTIAGGIVRMGEAYEGIFPAVRIAIELIAAPFLGYIGFIVLSIQFGKYYPQYVGMAWGMFVLNYIFLYSTRLKTSR